ncbi:MAG: sigma-54-dependent Fis family transcriptional regulator [Candidatus Wallbacteria bacterium]|nr:sigma-54-dependent Fis family transcriptional regulator [Candidatus Wallbacteria bacterium]
MSETLERSKMARILVCDDELKLTAVWKMALEDEGHVVDAVNDPFDALKLAGERSYDIMLTDIRMPKMSGLELLEGVKRRNPDIECVLVTAYASVETAISALRSGARDYVLKPVKLEELVSVVSRICDRQRLVLENQYLKERLGQENGQLAVIGESGSLKNALSLADKVASSDVTVLLRGESGTGKEVIAKYIHNKSVRAAQPLVTINCAAIPENLLESEFFGHERGAFTGAVVQKRGKCEMAQGGTLFLDEIGELSPLLQVKLLRLLQEKRFERVGGLKTIDCDARVIAATNANLEDNMKDGRFREDLYYRLNVVSITLPPLRDRPEDVPHLAKHFLKKFRKPNMEISEEAMDALRAYGWPGNVRELENVIERATVISDSGKIAAGDLPFNTQSRAPGPEFKIPEEGISLESYEQKLVQQAFERSGGVKTRTARLLGLTRRQLDSRLKKLGMD